MLDDDIKLLAESRTQRRSATYTRITGREVSLLNLPGKKPAQLRFEFQDAAIYSLSS